MLHEVATGKVLSLLRKQSQGYYNFRDESPVPLSICFYGIFHIAMNKMTCSLCRLKSLVLNTEIIYAISISYSGVCSKLCNKENTVLLSSPCHQNSPFQPCISSSQTVKDDLSSQVVLLLVMSMGTQYILTYFPTNFQAGRLNILALYMYVPAVPHFTALFPITQTCNCRLQHTEQNSLSPVSAFLGKFLLLNLSGFFYIYKIWGG